MRVSGQVEFQGHQGGVGQGCHELLLLVSPSTEYQLVLYVPMTSATASAEPASQGRMTIFGLPCSV